jgi:hypothetical protein
VRDPPGQIPAAMAVGLSEYRSTGTAAPSRRMLFRFERALRTHAPSVGSMRLQPLGTKVLTPHDLGLLLVNFDAQRPDDVSLDVSDNGSGI